MNRRRFLQVSGAAAGTFAAGSLLRGRLARGAAFGEFPAGTEAALLPQENQAKNVLEIFLYGGLSAWETLYLVQAYGRPDDPDYPNEQFHTFLGGGSGSVEQALSACDFPGGEPMGQLFARDALGADVELGPFAWQLRQRPDLTARMRLVVQRHTLEPHEAAVPQALTGRPVGQPSAAGLGSHVQRYFADRAGTGRAAPWSYVFATGGISGDNVSAAAATGAHPGHARPLFVKIDNAERFAELLGRTEIGTLDQRARYDELMNLYAEQYQDRLRWNGGEPVRSARFTDLALAVDGVGNVDAIRGVMADAIFDNRGGASCGASRGTDIPGMSLQAARHLLTHPSEPARYVCVSDVGLYEASGGGGYDTHTDNSVDTARNFNNLLTNLSSIVNAPGEDDPTKLDLDDTLIILNTEFGRTSYPQSGGSGRNHHPYGYVTAFIGGPITSAQSGIYGAIGPSSLADTYVLPSENRIGALLALGIWPFSPEAFAVSDVEGAGDELGAARAAAAHVLGYEL